ncbi:unnamed protein product [Trichogramma brassicae]|uniref:Uncharacterized protein n=1 Tax=Trichogramma brassicae TaxID=86971 RepID=A0A6H5I782_9HYME|nr:unnamed protein product [Trichogramma brassicae]
MHSPPPPPRSRDAVCSTRRTYTAVNARGGGVQRMQDHASFCLRHHHHHHHHSIFALDVFVTLLSVLT